MHRTAGPKQHQISKFFKTATSLPTQTPSDPTPTAALGVRRSPRKVNVLAPATPEAFTTLSDDLPSPKSGPSSPQTRRLLARRSRDITEPPAPLLLSPVSQTDENETNSETTAKTFALQQETEEVDYEAQRRANIDRNNRLLAELGLLDSRNAVTSPKPKSAEPKKRKVSEDAADHNIERRRSSRLLRGVDANTVGDGSATLQKGAQFEPDDTVEQLEVPEVGRALENVAGKPCDVFADASHLLASPLVVKVFSGHKHPIYSVSFDERADILLAGGGQGLVSLFDMKSRISSDTKEPSLPLTCGKVHSRWVSEVASIKLGTSSVTTSHFLSTADDGKLFLSKFDMDSLTVTPTLRESVHDSGIFSFHEQSYNIVTACKDGTVALTRIGTDFNVVRRFAVSSNVLKCVRWHDACTFACTGNDGDIRFFDSRSDVPSLVVEGAHALACNSLDFNTQQDDRIFYSSSFDRTIKLWDMRMPSEPLFTLASHHSARKTKASLTSPIFCHNGSSILTIGDDTPNLFRYSTVSGKLEKCAYLGFTPTCIDISASGSVVACHANKNVWVMKPALIE